MSQFGFKTREEQLAEEAAYQRRIDEMVKRAQRILQVVTDDYARVNGIAWKTRKVEHLEINRIYMDRNHLQVMLDPFPGDGDARQIIARTIQREIPLRVKLLQPYTWYERGGEYNMGERRAHQGWREWESYEP